MYETSEKTNEQNQDEIRENKGPNNILNSSQPKIIINNSQNNSIIDSQNLVDVQNLNIINNEMKNISLTGQTNIPWKELKPYIIYFYEKNVQNFSENQKNSADSNNINGDVELHFPFNDKRCSKDEQMDLNNSNEHNSLEVKHLNLMEDFHFSEENHLVDEVIKMNKENSSNVDDKNENIEKDIVEFINKINLMPFTIQRIAELLLEPKKYYSTLLKYNRAFYKLVNIDFD